MANNTALNIASGVNVVTSGLDVVMTYSKAMNSKSSYFLSKYFSDYVVLDWFGRTIVGKTNVINFLLEELCISNHDIIEVKSRPGKQQENQAFQRALSRFRQKEESDLDDSGFSSSFLESCDSSFSSSDCPTPCTKMVSSLTKLHVSKLREDFNCCNTMSPMKTPSVRRALRAPTALKRPSMVLKSMKLLEPPQNVRFVDAAGVISFCPYDDLGQSRTSAKHCHLQLGYHFQPMIDSISFCFLMYNDDMPCRRNLSSIFDKCV